MIFGWHRAQPRRNYEPFTGKGRLGLMVGGVLLPVRQRVLPAVHGRERACDTNAV